MGERGPSSIEDIIKDNTGEVPPTRNASLDEEGKIIAFKKIESERLDARTMKFKEQFDSLGIKIKLLTHDVGKENTYEISFTKGEKTHKLSLPGWNTNKFSMKIEVILEAIISGISNEGLVKIEDVTKNTGGLLGKNISIGKDFFVGKQKIDGISWRVKPRNKHSEEDLERFNIYGGYVDYLTAIKSAIEAIRNF